MAVELFLCAVAGAATAAAATRFGTKRHPRLPTLGASERIQTQVHTLESEKRILEKSISRLYADAMGLSEAQRDALIIRYQNQLGTISAQLDNLKDASRYPDLGSLGDGLVTIMDQKLSSLEEKFGELSSRIAERPVATPERKPKPEVRKQKMQEPLVVPPGSRRVELATLTEIPVTSDIAKPALITATEAPLLARTDGSTYTETRPHIDTDMRPKIVVPPRVEPVAPVITDVRPAVRPEIRTPPTTPPATDPDMDVLDDTDDDDLAQIKRDISATLKRIEQAEVE